MLIPALVRYAVTTRGTLFVPGKPAPQGSKKAIPIRNRSTGQIVKINQVESSNAVGPWRERIALAAHNWMGGQGPLTSAVRVDLAFVLPRPKSTPKTRTPAATKRPDLDKLARAVLDALTNVCWDDDSQVIDLRISKRLAGIDEQSGMYISIEGQPA